MPYPTMMISMQSLAMNALCIDLWLNVACTAAGVYGYSQEQLTLNSLMFHIAFLLADVYIVFNLFNSLSDTKTADSKNGLSIVSYIYKLDAKYIHTCNCIIKVYANTRNGSELKASFANYEYHNSSDSSSS